MDIIRKNLHKQHTKNMRHYNMYSLFNIYEFTILIDWKSAESSELENKIKKANKFYSVYFKVFLLYM